MRSAFAYLGTGIATNVAGKTWAPGDVNHVLDEYADQLRQNPDTWKEMNDFGLGPANTCVVLGDSVTENNTYLSLNAVSTGQRGYMTWANILLGSKRLDLLKNAGVSGENSTQILARLGRDVLAYGPSWCVVEGPTNDQPSFMTETQTIANLTSIYTRLLNAGIRVVAMAIIPLGSGHASWSQQLVSRHRRINQWIADYCAATPGMVFVDAWAAVVDSTQTDADPISGYYWDTPGIHPSAKGAHAMGLAIKNALDPFIPARNCLLSSDADDWASDQQTLTTLTGDGSILTATLTAHKRLVGDWVTVAGANEAGFNGLRQVLSVPTSATFTMAGTGSGTATGTVICSGSQNLIDNGLFQLGAGGTGGAGVTATAIAETWTVERVTGTPTVVATLVARADGIGNDQQMVVVSNADGDMIQLRGTDALSRAFVGETVYCEADISVSSTTNLNLLHLHMHLFDGGVQKNFFDGGNGDFTDASPTGNYSGVFRTSAFTYTGANTRLRFQVRARFSGVGGATIKVGRARLVKVLNR